MRITSAMRINCKVFDRHYILIGRFAEHSSRRRKNSRASGPWQKAAQSKGLRYKADAARAFSLAIFGEESFCHRLPASIAFVRTNQFPVGIRSRRSTTSMRSETVLSDAFSPSCLSSAPSSSLAAGLLSGTSAGAVRSIS